MKKIISIVLAICTLLMTTSAFAAAFNDVSGHWGEAEILSAADAGIVNGDGTGNFRPNDTVTRAEFIKMLSAVIVTKLGADDVPDAYHTEDNWYSKYYNFAISTYLAQDKSDVVDGINPGVFTEDNATAEISRWEMAYAVGSLIENFLGKELSTVQLFSDSAEVEALPEIVSYGIKLSAENKIMQSTGGGAFSPRKTGTRAEAVVVALRVNNLIDNFLEEESKKQQQAYEEAVKSYEDNRVTYSASEIPTSNVKVKFTMKDGGSFTVELYPKEAPQTVANFVKLVSEGFYDGLKFHRVIDGFMAQGGDPNGDGTGGSGKYILGEFKNNGFETNTLKHEKGTISMARASVSNNSASSQFFICYDELSSLDGDYAPFGKVIEGMDTVEGFLDIERNTSSIGELSVPTTDIVIEKATIVK